MILYKSIIHLRILGSKGKQCICLEAKMMPKETPFYK